MNSLFLILYFGLLIGLSLHGLHIVWLIYHRLRSIRASSPAPANPDDENLPRVTVQVPLFNEKTVAARVIDAVVAQRYPKDRLEIQILDDSTDETSDIVLRKVAEYRKEDFAIESLHRTHREGFKAGALEAGLKKARGDLIAIFDADFVPDSDFLSRTVPSFRDPQVGMTQVRWGHLNEDDSFLTRLQALFLDGHFVMESETRDRAGLFLTFNGTGGVWRKEAIVEAGGWESDTLTEDLDLSYRAQLAGWKFRFLSTYAAPAELPTRMEAFKSQQFRWTRGAAETFRKLGLRIGGARIPLAVKIEAFFHLTSHLVFPGLVLLSLCLYPALAIRLEQSTWKLVLIDLPLYFLGIFSVNLFYVWGQWALYPGDWKRVLRIPGLIFLGTGLAVSNTLAVWEAYRGTPGTFIRTPKSGEEKKSPYSSLKSRSTGLEIGLCLYLIGCILHAAFQGLWGSIPFLAVFAIGFGGAGLASLYERWQDCREGGDCEPIFGALLRKETI